MWFCFAGRFEMVRLDRDKRVVVRGGLGGWRGGQGGCIYL